MIGDKGVMSSFDKMEREQGDTKISKKLEGGVEIGGQPLAKAELKKNEQAPREHGGEEDGPAAAEKFSTDQGERAESEREQFRAREEPEGSVEAREARENHLVEFGGEPCGHAVEDFRDSGESPHDYEQQVDGEECSQTRE
jgi:hypothetical protein